jgi:hypothetical protein
MGFLGYGVLVPPPKLPENVGPALYAPKPKRGPKFQPKRKGKGKK